MQPNRFGFRTGVDNSVNAWSILYEQPVVVALAIGVILIQILAMRSGGPAPSLAIVRNPFAAIAAASVFCRYVLCRVRKDADSVPERPPTRSGRRQRDLIVYCAPLTFGAVLLGKARGEPMPLPFLDMLAVQGALGVVGFVVAACRATTPQQRIGLIKQLGSALILPAAASMVSFGLWASAAINPVYDGHIYAFERILGVSFSLLGVWSYHVLAPFSAVATACYNTLAIGIVLVAAAQRDRARESDLLVATVAAGLIGFSLYFACPVVGPLHAFGPLYPNALPPYWKASGLLTAAVGPPRNGMPSLHTVWALLIWFNAQRLSPVPRRLAMAFAAMTLWAVMGLDDTHWFTDVVVAVPLAVAIQGTFVTGLRDDASRPWREVAICAAITAAWLINLKFPPLLLALPGVLAWAVVVSTIVWPLTRASIIGGPRRTRVPRPDDTTPDAYAAFAADGRRAATS